MTKFVKVNSSIMLREKDSTLSSSGSHSGTARQLVLFNDDINTFEFIINTLIEVCNHEPERAEQCALIAHYNGKCGVLSGDHDELEPAYAEMLDRGITVEIQ